MENEYNMLRKEIEHNSNVINNYLSVLYAAVGVIITYIVNNPGNPLVFISIYMVIIPIAARVRSLNNSIARLSAYMIVFLEADNADMKYETRNYRRSDFKSEKRTPIKKMISLFFLNINGATFFIGFASYIFYIQALLANFSMVNLLIGGTISTLSVIVLIYFLLGDSANEKDKKEYIDAWKRIRNAEKQSVSEKTALLPR